MRDGGDQRCGLQLAAFENHLQHAANFDSRRESARNNAAGLRCRRPSGRARAAPGRFPARRRRRLLRVAHGAPRYRRCLRESSRPPPPPRRPAHAASASGTKRGHTHSRHGAGRRCGLRPGAADVGLAVLVVQAGQVGQTSAGARPTADCVRSCWVRRSPLRAGPPHAARCRRPRPACAWLNASACKPQPMLVKSEKASTRRPAWRARMVSGTVLMPTACAPGVAACGSRPASRTAG